MAAAPFVLDNAFLSFGGIDISTWVSSVTINYSKAEVESTAMSNTGIARLAGLADWSIDVTCNQDFTVTTGLDPQIQAVIMAGTQSAVLLRPDSGAVSTSNPEYGGNGIVFEYTPVDGSVGDLATTTFTITGSDGVALTRVTV